MPKKLILPREDFNDHSGIDITWTKTAGRLDFGGWYDHCVGIAGDSMTLRQFFDELGITAKDCEKAWKQSNAALSSGGPTEPQNGDGMSPPSA